LQFFSSSNDSPCPSFIGKIGDPMVK